VFGGRFAEPASKLLARFRLVEVVSRSDAQPSLPPHSGWLAHESEGRTLRFIDMGHDAPDAAARLANAFPAFDIRTTPLPLREIVVALARAGSPSGSRRTR